MKVVRWCLLLLLLAAGASVAWVWRWLDQPLPLATPTVELSIEPGANPRDVANAWVRAGVRTPSLLLYEWFRWSGDARRIRAGSYVAGPEVTPRQLLAKMVQGEEFFERVRLLEGWTLRQFRAELARAPYLRPASSGMSDAELMAALGAASMSPEGRFFPDTYLYSRGVSDLTVLKRAYDTMQRQLNTAWDARIEGLPLKSPDEALILASIVEKETGKASDRARIAGVFSNRLRIGMPLQTDPSVIYGLGDSFDGNLRKRDLLADGPYNTYTRTGLPPTPIAMPSLASIRAAVNPERTKALYFVARGDGGSVFSESLVEHNRAVNLYQRGGR
ncbi:MAG TPA: endolytic transglycosylase MltG [Burkholderiaceae bacterium]|nr:endolytic transglycosylase MltG [Burkholderiaceae bacterium]